ncbi:MAG: type II 3-dehydroquinate dehydratase [Bacteroidales bacterium]|nr:type II 3-dehydroquinate dehydratase [Bacteroidales bacterium]
MKILILNGPNLNLQGRRQPDIYGKETFEDYLQRLRTLFSEHEIEYYQSNVEGELINAMHRAMGHVDGLVVNAGGYSHTSVALHDALLAVGLPAVEVHLSNIYAREAYRHQTLLTSACRGLVCGLGMKGYELAVRALVES